VKANQSTKAKKEKAVKFAKDGFGIFALQKLSYQVHHQWHCQQQPLCNNQKITKMGNEGLAVKLPNCQRNNLFTNGDQLIDVDGNQSYHSGKVVVEGSLLNIFKSKNHTKQGKKAKQRPRQEESNLKSQLQFEALQLCDLEEFSKMKEMMMFWGLGSVLSLLLLTLSNIFVGLLLNLNLLSSQFYIRIKKSVFHLLLYQP
jgi:hypothetical protein